MLVGREAELARLLAAFKARPSFVLVEGEAGAGKTHLVQEALSQVGSTLRLTGSCCQLPQPFPFGPVTEALRQVGERVPSPLNPVAGALRSLVPEFGDLLPPLPPATDRGVARHQLFRAVAELLKALGPVIVVLEDLHWVDTATYELLQYLVAAPPSGLCLVLTFRGDELPARFALRALPSRTSSELHVARVIVEPLVPAEVHRLAVALHGSVTPQVARDLHRLTGGVPSAVIDVLRLIPAGTDLADPSRRTFPIARVPEALRDLVVARLAGLGREAQRVAQAAAVIGTPAPAGLIGKVARLSPSRTSRALTNASTRGLLLPAGNGSYAFRHPLAQQAVYETVPEPARIQLHSRAADVLVSHAAVAHHCRHAGRLAEWCHHAESAADEAIAAGDGEAAVALLSGLLGATGITGPQRQRLAVKLGSAAQSGLTHADSGDMLRQVIAEERIPAVVRGELRLDLGLLLCNQAGQADLGTAEIAIAVTELRDRPDLAARALSALAVPVSADVPAKQHLRWLAQAEALALDVTDSATLIAIAVNRATTSLTLGDPSAWDAVRQLPLRSADPAICHQLARGAMNLAEACLSLGYYRRARRMADRSLRLLERTGVQYQASITASIQLRLDWYTGQWAGLAKRADDASLNWAAIPPLVREAQLVAGLLRLAQGDLAKAEPLLAEIARPDGAQASLPLTSIAAASYARLLLSRGDIDNALTVVERALSALRRKQIWPWACELIPVGVDACLRAGRPEQAGALTTEFQRVLSDRDGPLAPAILDICEAQLHEAEHHFEPAARAFNLAAKGLRAMGRPYLQAQALEARGRCLLAAGVRSGATEVRSALVIYQQLAASWDAGRARALLRAHGIETAQRRGRRGYGDALSPREHEIALLAAAGRTNRQIASALHLSERTVEEHVAKALRKLGIGSRTDLPASLH